MSRQELLNLAQKIEKDRKLQAEGPQNDDELHYWVEQRLGVDIPRAQVCEGHDAPFMFLADLYFGRTDSAVLMANRGGSKTWSVALLHLLNMLYKPGVECCSVGAIEMQARRAYSHFLKMLQQAGEEEKVANSILSETRLTNGSKLEVMPGTISAVNGAHPQKVHFDEVELADPVVYQESRNMSASAKIGGKIVNAQDIITSTRKRGHGMMQMLLDEISDAKMGGLEPPYELYVWCIYETTEQQKNCQMARPELEECDRCTCDKVHKGKWENGEPRTLASVCDGKFYKARGWMPIEDVINTFTKVSREIWEAQQECSRPSTEGLVIPQFSRERHGIRNFEPDPLNGPVYMAVDFGGTNPHAVNWYQVLRYELEVEAFESSSKRRVKRRIPEGSRVCFDEIYITEIGNVQLAEMIVEKEAQWAHHGVYVAGRYADPQAKAARLDFARHEPALKTQWRVTREIEEHIKLCKELVEEDQFFVDVTSCPMFVEEIESWHYDERGKLVDVFNHCMSDFRYGIANIRAVEYKNSRARQVPTGGQKEYHPIDMVDSAGRSLPKSAPKLPKGDAWRLKLGAPVGLDKQ